MGEEKVVSFEIFLLWIMNMVQDSKNKVPL